MISRRSAVKMVASLISGLLGLIVAKPNPAKASLPELAVSWPTQPDVLFASEGDIATCENGHPICEVAKELYSSAVISGDSFRNFSWDYQPKAGTPIPRCPVCGERWITKLARSRWISKTIKSN